MLIAFIILGIIILIGAFYSIRNAIPPLVIIALTLITMAISIPVESNQIRGGKKVNNSLVAFTLGELKKLGGFTTLGESVCRAAIYLQTPEVYGKALLLLPHVGDWLRYNGIDLELDGLDEKHHLAFEYDGPQHYSIEEWRKMGKNREYDSARILDFYRARFYDRWKSHLCRERKIKLIRVSTWTSFDAMRNVVRFALTGDFDEHRTVDDSVVINQLIKVDTDDSSLFPQLIWNYGDPINLSLPTNKWEPHPFELPGTYTRLFDDDLARFIKRISADLITIMPRQDGAGASIHSGLMAKIKKEMISPIEHLVYTPQLAVVIDALEQMCLEVSNQLS